MRSYLFVVATLLLSTLLINNVHCQLSQPNRFEVPLGNNELPYNVIKGDDNQLLLFRETINSTDQGGQIWEVLHLDTTFQIIWKQAYAIDDKFIFAKHSYHNKQLNLLFTNPAGNRTDLELVAVNTETGDGVHHHIENLIPFNLTDFESSDFGVLIGGYYNYRPLVLYYHFESTKTKVLPGFYHDKSELVQLKVNKDETIDVILSGTSFGDHRTKVLEIKTFSHEGDLISNTLLDNDEEKSLLYGRSCDWKGDRKLIAGTYGRRNSEYSRGVFIANINQYGQHKVNFYNYGDLKNFFSYMKAKREKRVKDRIERRKIEEKNIKFNYRLLVHDVFQRGNQYIMLGEAFYPKYIHPTAASASGIFQRIGSNSGTETIFDGYRYTHAVVLGFDSKGDLLWDNSFEITDVKTFEREQFVKASVEKDRIVLLYVYDNVIRSKIIKENEVLEGKTFDELKLKFDNDVVASGSNKTNGLDKWYGNTFLAYGVQKIKNTNVLGQEVKRSVFFINKIVYQ